MNPLIRPRGELSKRVNHETINWSDLVFYADANDEPFREIAVITLKSHYVDTVFSSVLSQIPKQENDSIEKYFTLVEKKAIHVMNSKAIFVREHVSIDEELNVVICLDVDKITEDVVFDSLNILTQVEIAPNAIHFFGKEATFSAKEVQLIRGNHDKFN